MITALLVGLIKTILILFWNVINALLGFVFTNYEVYMAEVINSTGAKIAGGLIDLAIGWSWFVNYVGIAISVMIVIRLAKYLIGLLSKG
jgi:hypothetical protein